jgi:hypothetical protein
MLSRVRSVASRGADVATLSLTAPLLKVRLAVIAGADADVAAEFAEIETRALSLQNVAKTNARS